MKEIQINVMNQGNTEIEEERELFIHIEDKVILVMHIRNSDYLYTGILT